MLLIGEDLAMRKFAIAAALFSVLGLAGCGGGETTDPSTLPPLTDSDLVEIQQRDAEIQAEEQAPPGAPGAPRS